MRITFLPAVIHIAIACSTKLILGHMITRYVMRHLNAISETMDTLCLRFLRVYKICATYNTQPLFQQLNTIF